MKKPFYKKIWFWLVVLVIIGGAGAAASKKKDKDESEQTVVTEATTEKISNTTEGTTAKATTEATVIKDGKYAISINSYSVEENYDGSEVLIIDYSWTNNSDKETSFMLALTDRVYQNGIQCSTISVYVDDVSAGDQMLKIKPGVTNDIKIGYKLQDKTNVSVEVNDLYDSDDLYLKETIDLGGGEGTYNEASASSAETSVKIVDMFLSENYSGEDVLIVKYEYTNGEKKVTAFSQEFRDTVYQNGVECSSWTISEDADGEPSILYIKPGATIIVEEAYILNDTTSDVEIEVETLFGGKSILSEKRSIN